MVALRVETSSRWDALALARELSRYRWYLVEPDAEHWDVCVVVDDPDLPEDLRRRIESWLGERNLPAATIRAPEATFSLSRRG